MSMNRKKVEEIILPIKESLPLHPSVTMGDKIIHAIELMVNNNIKDITVVLNERPIGRVCLDDALKKLGMYVPLYPQAAEISFGDTGAFEERKEIG